MTVSAPAAAYLRSPSGRRLLDSQCQTSVALFKQSWSTYHKLLEVDFLEHRALYAALRQLLLREAASTAAGAAAPLAMLDLGCGDAMQIAGCLRECGAGVPGGALPLGSYTGVDMSAAALQAAAAYLAPVLQPHCSVELVEQDMKEYVGSCPDQRFHLAFASFAVHHLSLEGKAEFVAQVARCLKPGGLFVVVDIFRREGESRERFMERYRDNIAEAVARGIIDEEEAVPIVEHVTNHDWPEQLSDYRGLAAAAGFAAAECLATDSKEFGRLVVLRK